MTTRDRLKAVASRRSAIPLGGPEAEETKEEREREREREKGDERHEDVKMQEREDVVGWAERACAKPIKGGAASGETADGVSLALNPSYDAYESSEQN